MSSLANQALITCDSTSLALTADSAQSYLDQLAGWTLDTNTAVLKISKGYTFRDFSSALSFVNQVGKLADSENHHPRACIEWGQVELSWWTHSLNGLFINDFIMAARCDAIYLSTE